MRKQFENWWGRNFTKFIWTIQQPVAEAIYKAGFRAGRKQGRTEEKVRQFKADCLPSYYGMTTTRTRGPKVRIKCPHPIP